MNSLDRLVLMANQIATNLATDHDPAGATARHIARYWDPRMRKMIKAYVGSSLTPIAAEAIAQLT